MNPGPALLQPGPVRPSRPGIADWYHEDACSLAEFAALVEAGDTGHGLRFAHAIEKNVPLYDCAALQAALADPGVRPALLAEWAYVLQHGAGTLVLKGTYPDLAAVDAATEAFKAIIDAERRAHTGGGDHFAKPGANDRIWNALEKLCLKAPETFVRYYANPVLAAICEAWLGPHYQMTSQVNVVRPGGAAQEAHRDFHQGFQTAAETRRYPAHVHTMSPFLTLQGAVAHVDMPIPSGPTKLLPFSQRYAPGYAAWRRDDFRGYFEAHCVQLPLAKGDSLFFNPALFHAAGSNRTADILRMANLLQVCSAYGRAMESVDRLRMCEAAYPALLALREQGPHGEADLEAAIAACAEGYAFPTNLDRDPPLGGLAPPSQQDLLRQAVYEAWPRQRLAQALQDQRWRRETD